jgi:hypothetical protein
LSEQLAEASRKRREGKGKAVEGRAEDDDDSDDEEEDRVAVPPIPDLRFEQGVLASLRPFIHRIALSPSSSSSSSSAAVSSSETEKRIDAAEKEALVSTDSTAEGSGKAGEGEGVADVFDLTEGIRVEWGQVSYVLLRDQVRSTLFRCCSKEKQHF